MTPDKMTAEVGRRRAAPEPFFNVARANRALVLVRKIVADIVARCADLQAFQAERDRATEAALPSEHIETIDRQLESCAADLHALNQELTNIGCVLKDWSTGLVDFPARHHGRRAWLCWRLGEPEVSYWHDWDSGFRGRKPIPADMA